MARMRDFSSWNFRGQLSLLRRIVAKRPGCGGALEPLPEHRRQLKEGVIATASVAWLEAIHFYDWDSLKELKTILFLKIGERNGLLRRRRAPSRNDRTLLS